jgi:hypothetical protein
MSKDNNDQSDNQQFMHGQSSDQCQDDECMNIGKCSARGIHIIKGTGLLREFRPCSVQDSQSPPPPSINPLSILSSITCPYYTGCITITDVCQFRNFEYCNYINGDLVISIAAPNNSPTDCNSVCSGSFNFIDQSCNNNIELIDIFPNLLGINGTLYIYANINVTKITGFNKLKYVAGGIIVSGNESLLTMPSFNTLEDVMHNYSYSNPGCQSQNLGCGQDPSPNCDNFDPCKYIRKSGLIMIFNNCVLRKIVGFEKVRHVTEGIFIYDNPCLSHICGFINLINTDFIVIMNNDTLHQILGFCFTAEITRELIIYYNNNNNKGFDDLVINAFHKLETAGEVRVFQNAYLRNFTLDSLTFVGNDILIRGNKDLDSISMPALKFVDCLHIEQNRSLHKVNFDCLEEIKCQFEFNNNDTFECLDGFNALKRVGHAVQIINNTKLLQITGFKSLSSVGSSQKITINSVCQNVDLPFSLYAGSPCGCLDVVYPVPDPDNPDNTINAYISSIFNGCDSELPVDINYDSDTNIAADLCSVLGCNYSCVNCGTAQQNTHSMCDCNGAPQDFALIYSIIIFNNPRLKVIGGFDNLVSIASNLYIASNRKLHTVCAFPKLEFLVDLRLLCNKNLKYVYGFSHLKHARDVLVFDSPCLEQFHKLSSLPYVQYMLLDTKYAKSVKGIQCPLPSVVGGSLYYSYDKCGDKKN